MSETTELTTEELSAQNSQRLDELEVDMEMRRFISVANPETLKEIIDKNEAIWAAERDSYRNLGLTQAEARIARGAGMSLERYAELKTKRNGG
jgi:hypothetical protein